MIKVDFIDSSEVTTERIYQWDIGRKLKISNVGSAIAPVVHFCNKKSENALAVESKISGDFYIASVPNTLLQEEYDITAYMYVGTEEEAKTIKVVHIPVTKRLRPETYVTTEDEDVVDFLTISAEMKSLLNGLVITEYDSNKSYIKPNIVYYNGSSYICTSETSITNILPTDTTKWGLMCESGANVSEITFSADALHFKLQNNDIVDVPLGSIEISVVETNQVMFDITRDANGVLRLGDVVIPQRKLLWSGDVLVNGGGATITFNNNYSVVDGDKLEIVWEYWNGLNIVLMNAISVGKFREYIDETVNRSYGYFHMSGVVKYDAEIGATLYGLLGGIGSSGEVPDRTYINILNKISTIGKTTNFVELNDTNYVRIKAIYKIIE